MGLGHPPGRVGRPPWEVPRRQFPSAIRERLDELPPGLGPRSIKNSISRKANPWGIPMFGNLQILEGHLFASGNAKCPPRNRLC